MSVGTAEREGEEGERFTEALRLFRRQAIKILLLSLHQAWWEVWIVDMKQTSSVSQSQTTCSCHILLCSSAKTNNFIISTHKQNKLINKTNNMIDQISVQNVNSQKLILHYYCMFQKSGMHEWNRNYWCCEFQQ